MQTISYARHRFPHEIIRHAIWLYLRFTLSYRDVEELLAEQGPDVSYETIRRWVLKFGPAYARNLRRLRPKPTATWHLDEVVVSIQERRMYLWRAVDSEGEILDVGRRICGASGEKSASGACHRDTIIRPMVEGRSPGCIAAPQNLMLSKELQFAS
jgi:hypothetical protein